MEKRIFRWLGHEFFQFSGEARQKASAADATEALFRRFEEELKPHALSLEHAVRVRVWGRDRNARTLATAARSKLFAGGRRAASSSFISQQWFDSESHAGLELLAMRPLNASARRRPVDFAPPRNYLYYLDFDGVIFFSGFTSEAVTLEQQVADVLATYNKAIADAGTDWNIVKKLSVFLRRDHDASVVKRGLARASSSHVPEIEISFVDGFAGEKYQLEIEATAIAGA